MPPCDVYRRAHVTTSSRGDLLVTLLDGAIRYAHAAHAAIERRDPVAKGNAIAAALDILAELSATLVPAGAEALCTMLRGLYAQMSQRLLRAGLNMDAAVAQDVLGHLHRLRHTWAEAVVLARREGHRV